MFGYKETMKLTLAEFAAVTVLGIVLAAVSHSSGVAVAAIAFVPLIVAGVVFLVNKNEDIAERVIFILLIIGEFLSCSGAQATAMLPFVYIGGGVLVSMVAKKQLNIEYWVESSVAIIVSIIINIGNLGLESEIIMFFIY